MGGFTGTSPWISHPCIPQQSHRSSNTDTNIVPVDWLGPLTARMKMGDKYEEAHVKGPQAHWQRRSRYIQCAVSAIVSDTAQPPSMVSLDAGHADEIIRFMAFFDFGFARNVM